VQRTSSPTAGMKPIIHRLVTCALATYVLAGDSFSSATGVVLIRDGLKASRELDLMRYRPFHAPVGSISCKPFGGEIS
jgi:hypothetical protein